MRFSSRRAPGRARLGFVLVLIGIACALGAVRVGADAVERSTVAVPATPGTTHGRRGTGRSRPRTRTRRVTATTRAPASADQFNLTVTPPARRLLDRRRDVHVLDHVDAEQPDGRRDGERRDPHRRTRRADPIPATRRAPRSGRSDTQQHDGDRRRTRSRAGHLPGARVRLRELDPAALHGHAHRRPRRRRSGVGAASLPSADAQGLAFSAAVPADPQRDEAEPLIDERPRRQPLHLRPDRLLERVRLRAGLDRRRRPVPPPGHAAARPAGARRRRRLRPRDRHLRRTRQGNYQYAYAGLGALTGFTTSTSPDDGHSIAQRAGSNGNGLPGRDVERRARRPPVDDVPRRPHRAALVQPAAAAERRRPEVDRRRADVLADLVDRRAEPGLPRPDALHRRSSHTVVHAVDEGRVGEPRGLARRRSRPGPTATSRRAPQYVGGGTAGFATARRRQRRQRLRRLGRQDELPRVDARRRPRRSSHSCNAAAVREGRRQQDSTGAIHGQPTVDSRPRPRRSQVDRDAVRTTVFPWIAAGGAPGRVAVAFYGTTRTATRTRARSRPRGTSTSTSR